MKSDTNITFSETESQALVEAIRLANDLIESGIDLPEQCNPLLLLEFGRHLKIREEDIQVTR